MKWFLVGLGIAGVGVTASWYLVWESQLASRREKRSVEERVEMKSDKDMDNEGVIVLPESKKESEVSVEEAMWKRRSVREYQDKALTLEEISQLAWSAQGVSAPEWGGRTAPSAGALYPLELYLVIRKASELGVGVYHYVPGGHKLEKILDGDLSLALSKAALGQTPVREAPVNLVFTAFFERTTQKYGERGKNYVYIEVGHAAQNVYLQFQSLGLGGVVIGAFDEEEVKQLLRLAQGETPLYIMPVGRPFPKVSM